MMSNIVNAEIFECWSYKIHIKDIQRLNIPTNSHSCQRYSNVHIPRKSHRQKHSKKFTFMLLPKNSNAEYSYKFTFKTQIWARWREIHEDWWSADRIAEGFVTCIQWQSQCRFNERHMHGRMVGFHHTRLGVPSGAASGPGSAARGAATLVAAIVLNTPRHVGCVRNVGGGYWQCLACTLCFSYRSGKYWPRRFCNVSAGSERACGVTNRTNPADLLSLHA